MRFLLRRQHALRLRSATTERDGLRWFPCEAKIAECNDDCVGATAAVTLQTFAKRVQLEHHRVQVQLRARTTCRDFDVLESAWFLQCHTWAVPNSAVDDTVSRRDEVSSMTVSSRTLRITWRGYVVPCISTCLTVPLHLLYTRS